jgi:thiamine-monophosphate kinase
LIYVSGTLGEADRGWEHLQKIRGRVKANERLMRKHLYPQPRLALGEWLAKNGLATAAMDLSDGLSIDISRLCAASKVGALVEVPALPALRDMERGKAVKLALHGGDDYELLLTVAPRNACRIPKEFQGVRLTPIGRITRERKIAAHADDGSVYQLRPGGWDPFRK